MRAVFPINMDDKFTPALLRRVAQHIVYGAGEQSIVEMLVNENGFTTEEAFLFFQAAKVYAGADNEQHPSG